MNKLLCYVFGHKKIKGYTSTGTYTSTSGNPIAPAVGRITHYVVETSEYTHKYCYRCGVYFALEENGE